jgi:hypothetical protein
MCYLTENIKLKVSGNKLVKRKDGREENFHRREINESGKRETGDTVHSKQILVELPLSTYLA